MDNDQTDPRRVPRVTFGPDPRLTAGTTVLAIATGIGTAVTADPAGRLLLVCAATLLAGYALTDLIWRPRLCVDASGLCVRSPGASVRLGWAEVKAVRADVRVRHGMRSVALEIDAGERLIVLSRRALGADPERVAELAGAFAPG